MARRRRTSRCRPRRTARCLPLAECHRLPLHGPGVPTALPETVLPAAGREQRGGGAPASPAASGEVKSYPTRGGRVVLELAEASAKLVSATPEPGWSMQVWTNPEWIRVDFSDGAGATVSVFCTWNGHPPVVETVDQ